MLCAKGMENKVCETNRHTNKQTRKRDRRTKQQQKTATKNTTTTSKTEEKRWIKEMYPVMCAVKWNRWCWRKLRQRTYLWWRRLIQVSATVHARQVSTCLPGNLPTCCFSFRIAVALVRASLGPCHASSLIICVSVSVCLRWLYIHAHTIKCKCAHMHEGRHACVLCVCPPLPPFLSVFSPQSGLSRTHRHDPQKTRTVKSALCSAGSS